MRESGRNSRKHTSPVKLTSMPNKLLGFSIEAFVDNPLIFFSLNKVIELINEIIVIELVGDERHDGVDSVVLGGNIVDGCVADEYGEDETYDGCEYLADVGAGLSFLEM